MKQRAGNKKQHACLYMSMSSSVLLRYINEDVVWQDLGLIKEIGLDHGGARTEALEFIPEKQ